MLLIYLEVLCACGRHGAWFTAQLNVCLGWSHKWTLASMFLVQYLQALIFTNQKTQEVEGSNFQTLSNCSFGASQVEINRACIDLSCREYPESCMFPDVLKLVRNSGTDDNMWSPSKLRLEKEAHCAQHKRMSLRSWQNPFFWIQMWWNNNATNFPSEPSMNLWFGFELRSWHQ